MQSLISGLITSKMRIRILMRLFLNTQEQAYLRKLSSELSASPSQVKEELRHLTEAGLLNSKREGRHTYYRANENHPLFPELQSMVKKALGMDQIIESILERLGDLEMALLLDDYAQGRDTGIIDLLLIGKINPGNLNDIVGKTERYLERKIRTLILTRDEYIEMLPKLEKKPHLVIWSQV